MTMTVIEFFDQTAIENVLSALLCRPDRVIYVGYSAKKMCAAMEIYREILASRCLQVELSCRGVSRNDLQAIVETLTQIVEEYDDCVFNLDGGEDLYLVAMGIIAQRYQDKIQLHRFNVRTRSITDCDGDGNNQQREPIAIRVEENIRIYGGRVIYRDERENATIPWVFNEDFRQDVLAMWDICRQNTRDWNRLLGIFARLTALYHGDDRKDLHLRFSHDPQGISQGDMTQLKDLLRRLANAGVLEGLREDASGIHFAYKNQQIRDALAKAGTVLELFIAVTSRGLIEDDERVYNDVLCGVYLDWDGISQEYYTPDVYNEVDVLMMHGATPVFISCKNGDLDTDELYKVFAVAQRFGGKYAKAALITSSLNELGDRGTHIRLRAREMGIHIIDDVDAMSTAKLERALASLWRV